MADAIFLVWGFVLPDPDLNGTTAGTTMIVWPWGPAFVAATFPLYSVDFVAMGPKKRRMSFTQSSKSPATPNEMRHLYLDMTWILRRVFHGQDLFFCDLCFHMFSCPRWLPVGRNAGTPFKVGWPSPTLEWPSESSQCLDLLCLVRWAAWRMCRWAFPIGFTGVDAHEWICDSRDGIWWILYGRMYFLWCVYAPLPSRPFKCL